MGDAQRKLAQRRALYEGIAEKAGVSMEALFLLSRGFSAYGKRDPAEVSTEVLREIQARLDIAQMIKEKYPSLDSNNTLEHYKAVGISLRADESGRQGFLALVQRRFWDEDLENVVKGDNYVIAYNPSEETKFRVYFLGSGEPAGPWPNEKSPGGTMDQNDADNPWLDFDTLSLLNSPQDEIEYRSQSLVPQDLGLWKELVAASIAQSSLSFHTNADLSLETVLADLPPE